MGGWPRRGSTYTAGTGSSNTGDTYSFGIAAGNTERAFEGLQSLNIFAATYPRSEEIPCSSSAPADGIEQTVTSGNSSLRYDPATDTYTYVWKTDKPWSGTCRQLVVNLNDGTFHRANFEFT